ncbi:hypothetical protein L210DRAFT_981776 [Boletus edulis BED1]|uniref:Uncharacterized protein n=1 Tax=Boletus edulis BED1 TaxID=1328754 RepID=A0AAD4BU49_BOLED|nr:hypothetical protein L210DRAFT_981776 [Boletus edulis BED1]
MPKVPEEIPLSQGMVDRSSSGQLNNIVLIVNHPEEDLAQEKVAHQQDAVAKAKKYPLKMKSTQVQDAGVHVPSVVDKAFVSRAAGGLGQTVTHMDLAATPTLVARKGNVPPRPKTTMNNMLSQPPPHVCLEEAERPLMFEQLALNAPNPNMCKRVRDCEPTPFPEKDKTGDYADSPILSQPRKCVSHEPSPSPAEDNQPRKHANCEPSPFPREDNDYANFPPLSQPRKHAYHCDVLQGDDEEFTTVGKTVKKDADPVIGDGKSLAADTAELNASDKTEKSTTTNSSQDGKKSTNTQPKADNYKLLYLQHIKTLDYFEQQTLEMGILSTILNQVYMNGRLHAGVPMPVELDNIDSEEFILDDVIQDAIEEFSRDVEGFNEQDTEKGNVVEEDRETLAVEVAGQSEGKMEEDMEDIEDIENSE